MGAAPALMAPASLCVHYTYAGDKFRQLRFIPLIPTPPLDYRFFALRHGICSSRCSRCARYSEYQSKMLCKCAAAQRAICIQARWLFLEHAAAHALAPGQASIYTCA